MQNGSHHYKRAGSGALRTRIRLIYSTRLACSLHYAQICTAQSVLALLLLEGSDDLVGHVHGAVDVLDVVELLKTVDEALDLLGVGTRDLGRGGRTMVVSEPLTWTPCSSSALETAMTSLAAVQTIHSSPASS